MSQVSVLCSFPLSVNYAVCFSCKCTSCTLRVVESNLVQMWLSIFRQIWTMFLMSFEFPPFSPSLIRCVFACIWQGKDPCCHFPQCGGACLWHNLVQYKILTCVHTFVHFYFGASKTMRLIIWYDIYDDEISFSSLDLQGLLCVLSQSKMQSSASRARVYVTKIMNMYRKRYHCVANNMRML